MQSIDKRFAAEVFSIILTFTGAIVQASEPDPAGTEFFEKHIRPALVQHCYECHAAEKTKGGLRLDFREGWVSGGDTGTAIVPGKPDDSLLIQAIRYGGDYEMPPKGKLPAELIRRFEQWVEMGAPDPLKSGEPVKATALDLQAGRQHWAYQPPKQPAIPAVQDGNWPRNRIDHFILHRLEGASLRPAADAGREALVRRVYFDLTGLPPTPEEIDAFLSDESLDAYPRLVERLLSSPHFGERWGRRWLDVARFAESMTLRGFVFKEAWRYRDYVINTLNDDRPYQRFVQEQIAGDLMPAATKFDRERQLVATTFLALGNTNLEEQDKKQLEMDVIDEQLDVISKGFLAQTVTCARCHDHKFDPIPQRDYYALAGILRNTKALEHANVSKWVEAPLPMEPELEDEIRRHDQAIAQLQEKIKRAKEAVKLASADKSDSTAPALVVAATELPGIVVDDVQAKRVGDWQHSQFTKRYVGEGYLHDMKRDQGKKTLTFTPDLPRDGRYEVRLAYSPGDTRATAVSVTIFSADGEKTVPVDQTEPPSVDGRFVSLGQFRFEKMGQSFVIVSNENANGYVTADAVQFVPADMVVAATATSADKDLPATKGQLTASEKELKKLESELKSLNAQAPYRPAAMTVVERPEISNARINIRGIVHNLGDEVPRGFLQVCGTGSDVAFPADQSGRLQLAQWLADDHNPLTARVMVNRVWHALLGAGIVRTVDNFGVTGELPSHPELLDDLSIRFRDHHWSVKDLVREIVLSRTYCLSCNSVPAGTAAASIDPENRLLSYRPRIRLEAECLRDAMLSVSGQLRLEMGGKSFKPDLAADYGFQHAGLRRSVYEPIFRNALVEILEAFDFADPSLVTGRRSTSTVAPQALYLMNHPFVLDQAKLSAERLLAECPGDDACRVDVMYRRALGRLPSAEEKQAAIAFLASGATADDSSKLRAWTQLCQTLFATIDFRYLD